MFAAHNSILVYHGGQLLVNTVCEDGLPVISAHGYWQLAYLNQMQGEKGRRNNFIAHPNTKYVAAPGPSQD